MAWFYLLLKAFAGISIGIKILIKAFTSTKRVDKVGAVFEKWNFLIILQKDSMLLLYPILKVAIAAKTANITAVAINYSKKRFRAYKNSDICTIIS